MELRKTETDAGDRVIYVGSLEDGQNVMASYSFVAGKLKIISLWPMTTFGNSEMSKAHPFLRHV